MKSKFCDDEGVGEQLIIHYTPQQMVDWKGKSNCDGIARSMLTKKGVPHKFVAEVVYRSPTKEMMNQTPIEA